LFKTGANEGEIRLRKFVKPDQVIDIRPMNT